MRITLSLFEWQGLTLFLCKFTCVYAPTQTCLNMAPTDLALVRPHRVVEHHNNGLSGVVPNDLVATDKCKLWLDINYEEDCGNIREHPAAVVNSSVVLRARSFEKVTRNALGHFVKLGQVTFRVVRPHNDSTCVNCSFVYTQLSVDRIRPRDDWLVQDPTVRLPMNAVSRASSPSAQMELMSKQQLLGKPKKSMCGPTCMRRRNSTT